MFERHSVASISTRQGKMFSRDVQVLFYASVTVLVFRGSNGHFSAWTLFVSIGGLIVLAYATSFGFTLSVSIG